MALPKKKFREIVFQLLFCEDFSPFGDEIIPFVMRQLFVTKNGVREAMQRVLQIKEKLVQIDLEIRWASIEFSLERITKAELAILRLAIFEMMFDRSISPIVAISEAIRLSRKYATRDSAKYVNAVLDASLKKQAVPC